MGTKIKGICKLCYKRRCLQNSHIIPEFMYKYVYEVTDHRYHRVYIETGKKRIEQKGLCEPLLCASCESHFSDLERRFSLDIRIPDKVDSPTLQLDVDYTKVKLCLLSVLWRADVSSLDAFSAVTLGDKHENRLRDMLLKSDPGGEFDYGILGHIVLKPNSTTQVAKSVIAFPATRRHPKYRYRMYGFIAAGVMWGIYVTAPTDGKSADISLYADGRMELGKAPTPCDMPLAEAFSV